MDRITGESDSTPSHRVLWRIPMPLATELGRAGARMGSDADRLSRRMGVLDTTLRLLVAVQDAERASLGLDVPPRLEALLSRLEKPTLGLWVDACSALRDTLASAPSRLLPSVGDIVGESREAFSSLIEIRNSIAHGDELAALSPETARSLLAQSDVPFRNLVTALRLFADLRVVCQESSREQSGQKTAARIAVFVGREPCLVDVELPRPLESEVVYLVGPAGTLVPANPWLRLRIRTGLLSLSLLEKVRDRRPYYADASDPPEAAVIASGGFSDWLDKTRTPFDNRSIPPGELAMLFRQSSGERSPPVVAGLRATRRLGAGATGTVWEVEPGVGAPAPRALKVLHEHIRNDARVGARLRREFELLQRVRAPGVVEVYDLIEDEDWGPCLLMELIDGRSLAERLRESSMSPGEATRLTTEILRILGAAHEQNVIHRDVKPSNVLLDHEGRPHLVDFGIAKAVDATALTASAEVLGTRRYASPEQLRGDAVAPTADLYSVAVLFEELVSTGVARKVERFALTASLQRFIRRGQSQQPAMRFQSAHEMILALESAFSDGSARYSVGVGDWLSTGIEITAEGPELGPEFKMFRGHDAGGGPVSIIVPCPLPSCVAEFYGRFDRADREMLARHGCAGVEKLEDGLPYVRVMAKDDVRHAAEILSPGGDESSSRPAKEQATATNSPQTDSVVAPVEDPPPAPDESPGSLSTGEKVAVALASAGAAVAAFLAARKFRK